MGEAPFKSPCCCLLGGCPFSFLCTTMHMRYKVLNHVAPGSEWDNYVCCQGYAPACCCFAPGKCCEKELPRTCMCCEAWCCAGFAVSSSRFVLMDQYSFVADECDNRLVRFNNCIQILSCICHVAAMFNKDMRDLAQIVDCIADVVFLSTAGCMNAQINYEIDYREKLGSPNQLSGQPPLATVVSAPYGAYGAPPSAEGTDSKERYGATDVMQR
ncbi:hypothetical protein M885DRAFT_535977 [Pelagophyceae sp. CCMP2097]|nr:hypothetical protein M885DRAFT_535977 [Pelagophyceae sp. CCMP2097]